MAAVMDGKTLKINGVTYNDVEMLEIPLAEDEEKLVNYWNTGDAHAVEDTLLEDNTAYNEFGKFEGRMANRGNVKGEISTKDGVFNVQKGFHGGEGTVGISEAEKEKIISKNIKSGVNLLGVDGDEMVVDTTTNSGAGAANIDKGKIAFVNGKQVEGTGTKPSLSLTNGVLTIR